MASSVERGDALRALGRLFTGTEAGSVAARLEDSDSLSAALSSLGTDRRADIRGAITAAGLADDRDQLATVLRAVQGARSGLSRIEPLWTLPGLVAQTGPLTSRIPSLVKAARTSVTCSTFNFQKSSGLWPALHTAAQRPGVSVKIYIDTRAAKPKASWTPPTPTEIAVHLAPGVVLQTKRFADRLVRNHAKFLAIDHRFLLVSSANFSRSAEFDNVEFGVQIDDANLAEAVERQLMAAEALLYRRVVVA